MRDRLLVYNTKFVCNVQINHRAWRLQLEALSGGVAGEGQRKQAPARGWLAQGELFLLHRPLRSPSRSAPAPHCTLLAFSFSLLVCGGAVCLVKF